MKLRNGVLLLLVTVLVIVFSGCSKKDARSGGDAVTVYKVGTGSTMAPYCFLDESGNPTGYDVEVIKEIDKRHPEFEMEIEIMEFSALAVSLDTGKLDLATHQFVKTEERAAKFTIPNEYYCRSLIKLIVQKDRNDLHDLEDMKGHTLIMDPASFEYQDVVKWNEGHADNPIEMILVQNPSGADALKMVETGRADAAISYTTSFETIQKELDLDVKMEGVVFSEETYYLLAKKNTELAAIIDKDLKAMKEDGTLSALSEKWFGEDVFSE